MNQEDTWKFAAFGKHPAAKDFIRLGTDTSILDGFADWLEKGYAKLVSKSESSAPEFCSWRFWTKGTGKESIICGLIRQSSDSIGRPYPFFIMGTGILQGWEDNWDLLPLACENTWVQFEHLATHKFADVKDLETGMENVRSPSGLWNAHSAERSALNQIGSSLDPYASFIDLDLLNKQAACLTGKTEAFVSLDRGSCTDKILPVSLWHNIFRGITTSVPNAMFLGGTLDKAYMAMFIRALCFADFIQLWSVSTARLWKNAIGTEYFMDLLLLGKESVSAERPGGRDIRYDPAYEEIEAEIDKLSSPSASSYLNWEKIVRVSSDILAHKSKDLLVASYLAVALIYTRKHDGLSIGIKLMLDLMEKFWDDLYPPKERIRGRFRSMEWWSEKTLNALKSIPEGSVPSRQVELMRENLEKIEQFMQRHIDGVPSVSRIIDSVELLAAQPIRPSKDIQIRPLPPVVDEISGGSVSHDVPAMEHTTSPQAAHRMMDNYLFKLREIVSFLWQQDPANPMVYRLNRNAVWINIDDLPPSANGKTRIPPPDNQTIKVLCDMRNNGNTEALLKFAEGKLCQYIFWMDLNRYVAESLVRLGDRYLKAHSTVCRETTFLLDRLPGLEELSFSDGMPFASSETRVWITSISLEPGRQADGHGPVQQTPPDGAEEVIAREIGNARKLVREGRLVEAIGNLHRELKRADSDRDRILWRMGMCQMLVEERQGRIALPHIELVLKDIDSYRLEEYEPSLTLRALKLAWRGLDGQLEQEHKARANDVLCRIARMDMAEALLMKISKGEDIWLRTRQ